MKYDDASWHWDSVKKYATENEHWAKACGHIVVMIRWCSDRGILKAIDDIVDNQLKRAKKNEITFTEYFIKQCDCKFTDEDVNDEGQRFLTDYYELYGNDIEHIAKGYVFTYIGEKYPYQKIKAVLDTRYSEWKTGGKTALIKSQKLINNHPWWKVW